MNFLSYLDNSYKRKSKRRRLLLLTGFSLHSLYDDRSCFRYYNSPGYIPFYPTIQADPFLFRNIMHIYPETFGKLCNCLKQPYSSGEQNEYYNYFGPEFKPRFHSYEVAVMCGVLATTQVGAYHLLAHLVNVPSSTFRFYVKMFNIEMVKRKNDHIFFPLPEHQTQLPGNEYGSMNGAVFAIGSFILMF